MLRTQISQEQMQGSEKKKQYQQPDGFFAGLIWRLWIKTKVTFALSMMEPWEIILIFIVTGLTALLVTVGLVRYFPHAIVSASRRAQYYLSGSDALADSLKAEAWGSSRVDL